VAHWLPHVLLVTLPRVPSEAIWWTLVWLMQACLLELGLLQVAELVHPTHAAELVGGIKE